VRLSLILLLVCLLAGLCSADNTIGLYGGVQTSEQETADFVADCVTYDISPIIPSIGGTYALWQTGHRTYHPDWQPLLDAGFDALESLINHAHDAGLKVYTSVTVYNSNELFGAHPEWATKDKYGNSHSSGLAFSYPAARAAKIPLFMDLVCYYDIDGLWVDYCRYPEPIYGFDQPIIDECINNHGFDPRTVSESSPEYEIFRQIRAQSVTDFVGELHDAALQCNPDIRFIGFGGPDPNSDARNYGRDYIGWARSGHLDEVHLAIYPEPISQMREIVQNNRNSVGNYAELFSSLCVYNGWVGTEEEMIQATREQITGGADGLWIYREDYLTSLGLWDGAKNASYKCWKILNVPTSTLIEYKASLATGDPTTVSPPWTLTGSSMTDMGDYLLQSGSGTQTGEYLSPLAAAGLMISGGTSNYGYGIEFRIQPTEDIPTATGDYDNLAIRWGDDTSVYRMTVDKDSDDGGSGTTGGLLCGSSNGQILVAEYDASTVSFKRPDQVVPAWEMSSNDPAAAYDDGDYFTLNFAANDGSQSTNNGDYGCWTSPYSQMVSMVRGAGEYTIEAKVRPVDDLKSISYSYEYANMKICWADDVYSYMVCIDKDSDDGGSGTTGRVTREKYPMQTVIGDIDWSVPHTLRIEYQGSTDTFDFYLDDVYKTSLSSVVLQYEPTYSGYQNRICFGDSTTGGYHPDYNSQWYFVRLYGASSASVTDIDWSVPHTVFVAYHNDDSMFYIYVDGVFREYIPAADMRSGAYSSALQDRVAFGDSTSSGGDLDAKWYFVRVHDTDACGNVEHRLSVGDVNLNCVVDAMDFALLGDHWQEDSTSGDPNSTPVAEYDASKVTDQRPDEISPAWSAGGLGSDPSVCSDDGDYLLMDVDDNDGSQATNDGDQADWTSPASQIVTMTRNSGEYSIEVKVKPLGDIISASYRYEYDNLYVGWSDDVNYYIVSFDMDYDDGGASTLGRVTRGKYPLTTVINNVDWSEPHTLTITYDGSEDTFDFYLDDSYKNSVSSSDLAIGSTQSSCQNRVRFGDSTTLGYHPDYSAEWYFVRLYDHAISTSTGICGDAQNPYPIGDVNFDCIVDALDLAVVVSCWLDDTRP